MLTQSGHDKACSTKYPILLVHGVGFRDWKYLNYWGRIPGALKRRGADVYYGNQDSWASIEHNAATLKTNIEQLLAEYGHEKVNIIAHSKGGLEARYMISTLDMADKVASLVTIATPHKGSKTVDLFLRLPDLLYRFVAFFADRTFRLMGDENPDFYKVSRHFTTGNARNFNEQNPDSEHVYYQSYAVSMKNPFSDLIFFWSNLIISLIEGENDGIVSTESAEWTGFKGVLQRKTNRGISHADVVDVRRYNFARSSRPNDIIDIRAVYIQIVSQLKQMGY